MHRRWFLDVALTPIANLHGLKQLQLPCGSPPWSLLLYTCSRDQFPGTRAQKLRGRCLEGSSLFLSGHSGGWRERGWLPTALSSMLLRGVCRERGRLGDRQPGLCAGGSTFLQRSPKAGLQGMTLAIKCLSLPVRIQRGLSERQVGGFHGHRSREIKAVQLFAQTSTEFEMCGPNICGQ